MRRPFASARRAPSPSEPSRSSPQHKPAAEELGRSLAELTGDPEAFARALNEGLATLADPEYLEGQRRIAPGIGDVHRRSLAADRGRQARLPRVDAGAIARARGSSSPIASSASRRSSRAGSPSACSSARSRTSRSGPGSSSGGPPARRRDWITVDALAHAAGKGILNEAYRWAELEQLVYSPSRWERRLVGSTVATMPFVDHRRGREPIVAANGLDLIGQLIGDDEPDVQKALAWALRSLVLVDPAAVATFCDEQAGIAERTNDGHRAWVIRDALSKLTRRPRRADQGPTRRDPPPRRSARDVHRGRGRGPIRPGHARPAAARASADRLNERSLGA